MKYVLLMKLVKLHHMYSTPYPTSFHYFEHELPKSPYANGLHSKLEKIKIIFNM